MICTNVKKTIKLLVVTPYYTPNIVGGAEISNQCIAEGMQKRGHDVTVLTYSDTASVESINEVKVIRRTDKLYPNIWKASLQNGTKHGVIETLKNLMYRWIPNRKIVSEYKQLLENIAPDIVIINSNEEFMARPSLWSALSKLELKNILTFRDPILLELKIGPIRIDKIYRLIVSSQIKKLYSFCAPSSYMMTLYNRYISDRETDYKKVIPNSVDIKIVKCNYESKSNVILYAGNLRKEKGVNTLVEAFKKISHRYPDYELLLIGRGELENDFHHLNKVRLIPWVDRKELYQYMSVAKCLVLPSEWPEAFGRTIIESVFNGTIAIGSDYAAIPEIITERKLRFEMGNVDSLAQRLEYIIGMNPLDYDLLIKKLQNEFERFTEERFIDSWENYINQIIG